jgi:Flp pilus assembly secretin CpaC
VIGNPFVADGTIQSGGLLVVTGKGYGTTNLIALDARGAVLTEYTVKVAAPRDNTLTLWRGVERETWTCGQSCERAVVLGDSKGYFDLTKAQQDSRNGLAESSSK